MPTSGRTAAFTEGMAFMEEAVFTKVAVFTEVATSKEEAVFMGAVGTASPWRNTRGSFPCAAPTDASDIKLRPHSARRFEDIAQPLREYPDPR